MAKSKGKGYTESVVMESNSAPEESQRAPLLYVSYVSHDTKAVAERVVDHLVRVFGQDQVFFDRHLEAGAAWPEALMQRLEQSSACLVLIGEQWAKRVSEKDAFVRQELAAAVLAAKANRLALLPVLVDGAHMPQRLPSDLMAVRDYHAPPLRSDEQWDHDIGRLIARLQQLGFVLAAPPPPGTTAPLDPAAATDLCTLAFRLVLDFKAQPELLRHFEPGALQKALRQWETENRRRSEAPWAERMRAALESLAARQSGQEPNRLWLAWMLETQSFRLQSLQAAVAIARPAAANQEPNQA